jgi:hypothetical protein
MENGMTMFEEQRSIFPRLHPHQRKCTNCIVDDGMPITQELQYNK